MQTLPRTNCIELLLTQDVLHLTLNRPTSRNAMTSAMIAEIAETFDILNDSGVRAVVIRGAGGNFCAGGDVKEMSPLLQSDIDTVSGYSAAVGHVLHKINTANQAVIAIVEGAALGGGFGLACVADVTIALATARFSLPETTLGLVPAQVAPFIRQRIGESYARMLSVTGAQLDARAALDLGLAHYLAVNEDDLRRRLEDVLSQIKLCAPGALATAKHLMLDSTSTVNSQPTHLAMIFAQALLGEEAHEGTRAFMERRRPNWSN